MQKIPKIEQAEREIKEAQDRLHEIDVSSAQISRGCDEAEHHIGILQERLPALLSTRAMGDYHKTIASCHFNRIPDTMQNRVVLNKKTLIALEPFKLHYLER